MHRQTYTQLLAVGTLCVMLSSCASHPSNRATAPSAETNTGTGTYKVGQPYQVDGEWYYPREDYSYDETGVASWYGSEFHGQRTANGEVFNKNELTAAHKTLPLPTLARITNLDNGRSIVVRINDRGPFSGARLIDVSERAAQLLGFEVQGTAKVRVQVLADESKAIADAMRHYGSETVVASADNQNPPPSAPLAPEVDSATTPQKVETETLDPIRTTPETHRELLVTKPVPEVVMVPVPTTNKLFVQAGAFTVVDNANKLAKSLSSLGQTSISTIVINGTTFYRVRIGPIVDVPHADALLVKVKQSGISGARTVIDH